MKLPRLFAALLMAGLPAAVAAAKPADDVRCVFDQMDEDDREIALLLLVREFDRGNFRFEGSEAGEEIDTLVEQAHNLCLDHYNWSIGKSDSSRQFALVALMREAIVQLMRLVDRDPFPVESYFQKNSRALAALDDLGPKDMDELAADLDKSGWAGEDKKTLEIAKQLLHLIWIQEKLRQDFRRW